MDERLAERAMGDDEKADHGAILRKNGARDDFLLLLGDNCRIAPRARLKSACLCMDRNTPRPTEIKLHQRSRLLEVAFDDGLKFELPCEYLRVFSPSAEVRGHGPGQEVLQTGKREVGISAIEPVGVYAVKLVFSDGHDTGIYSWDYLHELGVKHETNWKSYLARMAQSGKSRE